MLTIFYIKIAFKEWAARERCKELEVLRISVVSYASDPSNSSWFVHPKAFVFFPLYQLALQEVMLPPYIPRLD